MNAGVAAGIVLLICIVCLLIVLGACNVSGWYRERDEYIDWLSRQERK